MAIKAERKAKAEETEMASKENDLVAHVNLSKEIAQQISLERRRNDVIANRRKCCAESGWGRKAAQYQLYNIGMRLR